MATIPVDWCEAVSLDKRVAGSEGKKGGKS